MEKYLFDQFCATRLYRTAAYSPDGSQIAYVDNTTGQFNLWTIEAGGGIPRQLTTFEDHSIRQIRWSPDSSYIAFTADEDSDEFTQVYVIDSTGGWPRKITDSAQTQYSIADWTADSKKLVLTGNDDNPACMDPQIHDLETDTTERLMTGDLNYAGEISPDGKYLTICRITGNTNQDILVLELDSGEAALVTPHEGEVINVPQMWSKDSSGFYLLTNRDREFTGVAYYDLASGTQEWVFTPDADVEDIALSEDGSILVFIINQGGTSRLYGIDLDASAHLALPDLPTGVAHSLTLAPDGSSAVVLFTSSIEASNLYEINFQTGGMVPLGQSMLGGIRPSDMIHPELIHYKTFDDRDIPAWFYRPRNSEAPFPVVLSIHGGPESQERPVYNYNGLYQYLLNRGIGVLAPNIRGSTGYGISYQKLIHRDWGGGDLKDIEHAFKYLHSLPDVDKDRIAVFGGSFGGFATLSTITRLPDYASVAVDLVGPSNLVTFLKSVPPHWRPMMKHWLGDVEEDYDFLMERSPITYVDQITVPLLVIQGANDPRVVKAESDQMVERIRENGGDVEYYVDPEEGHGAQRRSNMIKWMRMTAEYLESHLIQKT